MSGLKITGVKMELTFKLDGFEGEAVKTINIRSLNSVAYQRLVSSIVMASREAARDIRHQNDHEWRDGKFFDSVSFDDFVELFESPPHYGR